MVGWKVGEGRAHRAVESENCVNAGIKIKKSLGGFKSEYPKPETLHKLAYHIKNPYTHCEPASFK